MRIVMGLLLLVFDTISRISSCLILFLRNMRKVYARKKYYARKPLQADTLDIT